MSEEIIKKILESDDYAGRLAARQTSYGGDYDQMIQRGNMYLSGTPVNAPMDSSQSNTKKRTSNDGKDGVVMGALRGAATGVLVSSVGNVLETADLALNWANSALGGSDNYQFNKVYNLKNVSKLFKISSKAQIEKGGTAAQVTNDIAEVVVGMIPAVKGLSMASKATGIAKAVSSASKVTKNAAGITKAATAGAVAGVTVVTPETENMSNLVKNLGVQTALTDYLAIDPKNDSIGEMKFKQAIDSALTSVGIDTLATGIMAANKRYGISDAIVDTIKSWKQGKAAQGASSKEIVDSFDLSPVSAKEQEEIAIESKDFIRDSLKELKADPAKADDVNFINSLLEKEVIATEDQKRLESIFGSLSDEQYQSIKARVEQNSELRKALEEEDAAKAFEDEITARWKEEQDIALRNKEAMEADALARKEVLRQEKIVTEGEAIARLMSKDSLSEVDLEELSYIMKDAEPESIAKADPLVARNETVREAIESATAKQREIELKRSIEAEKKAKVQQLRDFYKSEKEAGAKEKAMFEAQKVQEETNYLLKNAGELIAQNRTQITSSVESALDNLKGSLSITTKGKLTKKDIETLDKYARDISSTIRGLGVAVDDVYIRQVLNDVRTKKSATIANSIVKELEKNIQAGSKEVLRKRFRGQTGAITGEGIQALAGAAGGAIAGQSTVDEDDTTAEKLLKILGGAGAGLVGMTALQKIRSGRMTAKQQEVFEKQNPTVAGVARVESVIDEPVKKAEAIAKMKEAPMTKQLPSATSNVTKEEMDKVNKLLISGKYSELDPKKMEEIELFANMKYIDNTNDLATFMTGLEVLLKESINKAKVGGLGNQVTGVRTWEQTEQAAEKVLTFKNARDLYNATNQLDVKLQAARLTHTYSAMKLRNIADELQEMESKIKLNTFSRDSAEYQAKLLELNNASELFREVELMVTGSKSEIGRALNSLKIMAKEENAMKLELSQKLGSLDIASARRMSAALKGMKHPAQISVVHKMSQSKLANALIFARMTGLLWSPITQTVNIGGNIINQGVIIGEKVIKGGISSINNSLFRDDKVEYGLGDAIAYTFGYARGLKDLFLYMIKEQEFDSIYKATAGNNQFDVSKISDSIGKGLFEEENAIGDLFTGKGHKAFKFIGNTMGLNLRFMASTDAIAQALAFRATVAEKAYRRAKTDGLTGEAFTRRVEDLISDPPEEFILAAEGMGRTSTYQDAIDRTAGKSPLDAVAALAQEAKSIHQNVGVNFATNILLPFIKTPTNILKRTFERIPGLNLLAERSDNNSLSALMGRYGREKQIDAASRFAVGATGIWMGMDALDSGVISIENNGQNLMLNLGDRQINLAKIEPIGTILGYGAILRDAYIKTEKLREVDPEAANNMVSDILGASAQATFGYIGNKSYTTTLFDFLGLVNDYAQGKDERGERLERFLDDVTVSFMPFGGMSNYLRNVADEERRIADGAIEKLMNKIPLLSDDLVIRRDGITGDAIKTDPTAGSFKKRVSDPALDELARLDVRVKLPKSIKGVELSPKQRDRLIELATKESMFGYTLHEAIKNELENPSYQDSPDGYGNYKSLEGTKRKTMQDIVRAYYANAQQMLLEEEEDITRKLDEAKAKKDSYLLNSKFLNDAVK